MKTPKPIRAMAVVGTENRLSAREVYSMQDSMSIALREGERKIKVEIRAVKAPVSVRNAPGRVKSRKR